MSESDYLTTFWCRLCLLIKKVPIAALPGRPRCWILESGETTNKGGVRNNSAGIFYLGDNAQNKQYRSILSFRTKGLPNNAVITKVTLKLRKQGMLSANLLSLYSGEGPTFRPQLIIEYLVP